jgi:hypothetical protein
MSPTRPRLNEAPEYLKPTPISSKYLELPTSLKTTTDLLTVTKPPPQTTRGNSHPLQPHESIHIPIPDVFT